MWKPVMITNSVAALAAVFVLAAIVSVSAGAKEKPVAKAEIKSLIANAETKADHERIARYFDAAAVKYFPAASKPSITVTRSASHSTRLPKMLTL